MGVFVRNDTLHQQVIERLKQLRKERGLTQEKLQFELKGINIGNIERGINSPSLTTLGRLCKFYNISLSEFFKGIEVE